MYRYRFLNQAFEEKFLPINAHLLFSSDVWVETTTISGPFFPDQPLSAPVTRTMIVGTLLEHCTSHAAYSLGTNGFRHAKHSVWKLFDEKHRLGGPAYESIDSTGRLRYGSYAMFGRGVSQQQHDEVVTMLDRWSLPAHTDDTTPEAHYLRTFWKLKTMLNRAKWRKLLRSDTARMIIEADWHPEGRKAKRLKTELLSELSSV